MHVVKVMIKLLYKVFLVFIKGFIVSENVKNVFQKSTSRDRTFIEIYISV